MSGSFTVYLQWNIDWFRLYYTKIGIGNPSRDFFVQVDTGSDILWVNCAGCEKCPTKSNIGVSLNSDRTHLYSSLMDWNFWLILSYSHIDLIKYRWISNPMIQRALTLGTWSCVIRSSALPHPTVPSQVASRICSASIMSFMETGAQLLDSLLRIMCTLTNWPGISIHHWLMQAWNLGKVQLQLCLFSDWYFSIFLRGRTCLAYLLGPVQPNHASSFLFYGSTFEDCCWNRLSLSAMDDNT